MRLQNYELGESFLAVGPSTFFRAQNVILGHPVVVRRVTIDPARAEDVRATFFREARHAAALWHARIWKPLDVLEADGFLWSVHENRMATTLEQVVEKTGPLSLARVARLGVQMADALAHIHARGWVHGKVTTRTVTLDDNGDAELINFVKSADLAAGLWPLRPVVLGLSAYSAPEELHGERPGPPADLYGLAATLLFCLTGRLPRGGDEQEALALARAGDPVDTSALRQGVPQALASALEGALDADPHTRHGSVAALGSLLAELERRHVADIPAGFEAGTILPPLCEEGDVRIAERPVIADFGVARTSAGARLTMTGQLVGSPAYMAPEQVSDQGITSAVDLYAVGVMLYELLTGHTPFGGSDALTTLRRIRDEVHAPLPAEVPEELRRIVDRLLAKAPGERFGDAFLLAAALDHAAAASGEPVPSSL